MVDQPVAGWRVLAVLAVPASALFAVASLLHPSGESLFGALMAVTGTIGLIGYAFGQSWGSSLVRRAMFFIVFIPSLVPVVAMAATVVTRLMPLREPQVVTVNALAFAVSIAIWIALARNAELLGGRDRQLSRTFA